MGRGASEHQYWCVGTLCSLWARNNQEGRKRRRRAGKEVTAPQYPAYTNPTIPLPKTPSHHHRREKRRLLDHRPPRETEADRDTDAKTDRR